jgi:hypothetical protein
MLSPTIHYAPKFEFVNLLPRFAEIMFIRSREEFIYIILAVPPLLRAVQLELDNSLRAGFLPIFVNVFKLLN